MYYIETLFCMSCKPKSGLKQKVLKYFMWCVMNLGNIEVSCFEFNYERTNFSTIFQISGTRLK